jgi:hypothetical protein
VEVAVGIEPDRQGLAPLADLSSRSTSLVGQGTWLTAAR